MKKIFYLFTFIFILFFINSPVKAYVRNVTINYDNFSYVEENSSYMDLINGIRSKLDNTNYYYYIYIDVSNSNALCSSLMKSQSDYDTGCGLTTLNNNSFYVNVVIFNPELYDTTNNTVNGLYFSISGGNSVNTTSSIGPVALPLYSSNTDYVYHDSNTVTRISHRKFVFAVGNDLSNLDSWLLNPNFTNNPVPALNVGYHNSTSNYIDFNADYVPFYIYKNFNIITKYYRRNTTNFTSKLHIIIDDVDVVPEVNENIDFILNLSEQIKPPVVSNLGNYSYQISSNQIIIRHSSSLDTINCPVNTDFVDNFCYTSYLNYSNISDISSSNIFIYFDLGIGSNIPYLTDNYYSFTFRVDSNIDLDITNIIIHSGNLSNGRVPININKYAYGLYTDYQVIFQAPSDTNLAVNGVSIRLNSINSSDLSDFSLGVYNKYTYKQFGTTEPTLTEQNNYYNNNSLDTIDNNKSSWFTGFHINDRGLSSIITAPFRYFRYIINSNGVCSSFSLPTYYFGNIQMPCIQSILYSRIPDIVILYRVIMSGLICYYVIVGYYKLVMVCFNPTDSRIEVVDL